MLVRQLEEEVVKTRAHAKETNPEIKAHIESLQIENDALTREVAILKETTKVNWELEISTFSLSRGDSTGLFSNVREVTLGKGCDQRKLYD